MKIANRNRVLMAILFWISLAAGPRFADGQSNSRDSQLSAPLRPNIVWIMSEDNSAHHLRLFNGEGAATPHLAKLAAGGIVFDRAFSNSPVCSVARTTLITSIYAPRLGTQFHRKLNPVGLPPSWKLFPQYLKEAGYYTTNNAKTDYNVSMAGQAPWNASNRKATWRNRDAGQPFFHVQTFTQSHESSLHFPADDLQSQPTQTDPARIQLPPFYPDTPLFRYTQARYHDRIGVIDNQVGRLLARLAEDDLLDDTFIFYFGDHGGVLPRSKGYVYETGLHVPLIVHIPENFRHLSPFQPGQRTSGFVQFVDFGPTVLRLAGLEPPAQMNGKPFLGQGVTAEDVARRDSALGYADRFDEKYDLVRSLRVGNMKYLRNFNAIYPNGLENQYRYKMAAYRQWRELSRAGSLDERENRFFQSKPAEELYDLASDPYETRNLAGTIDARADLLRMRQELVRRMKAMPDTSLYPESYVAENTTRQPVLFSATHQKPIGELLDTANLSLQPFEQAAERIAAALHSESPWQRYWGLVVCSAFGQQAARFETQAEALLNDPQTEVRWRAIEFLGLLGSCDPLPHYRRELEKSENLAITMSLLNSLVYYNDFLQQPRKPIELGDIPFAEERFVRHRLDYLARPVRR
ncbi:MAG: sulfatase-like hydrolase/transferase [Mariniblastus sp.]|nr:sulfatase-like hydrolase/transferase [Mariniblastus sp.]